MTIKNIPRIDLENWTYSYYSLGDNRAQINLTGVPTESNETEFLYSVTVLKDEEVEISLKDFNDLESACTYINDRYKRWALVDGTNPKGKEGSCSSCQAH
ncbi:MAG: hypothetical protein JNM93_06800 [Bacteriovoracaceae bacterium]|nr:hypothetical protein [Bacteriovoracaceae bacterium]